LRFAFRWFQIMTPPAPTLGQICMQGMLNPMFSVLVEY
jgi:hypothetical protein